MNETNFLVNKTRIQATLFDIGTHLFHNGHLLLKITGPYIYIPKMESYEDAIYVKKIIKEMEEVLFLPKGSVKITV